MRGQGPLRLAPWRVISVGFHINGLGDIRGCAGKRRAGRICRLFILAIDLPYEVVPPIVPGDADFAVHDGPHTAFRAQGLTGHAVGLKGNEECPPHAVAHLPLTQKTSLADRRLLLGELNSIRAMSAKRKLCWRPSLKTITMEPGSASVAALGAARGATNTNIPRIQPVLVTKRISVLLRGSGECERTRPLASNHSTKASGKWFNHPGSLRAGESSQPGVRSGCIQDGIRQRRNSAIPISYRQEWVQKNGPIP